MEAPLILVPADRSLYGGLRLIALVYLGIGLYVLLRRWTAPKSTHFYVFCLVSFIFYSFHYTGKLNDFDWIVYWSNVVAWLLQPALFLHFSLTFPERKRVVTRLPWLVPLVYVPGAILLAAHISALTVLQPSEVLRWNLDRVQMAYLALYFIFAAYVLWHSYRHADSAILRQQMKWVTRGTILAVAPFTLFYVIPYLSGSAPTLAMKVSVLSLVFLPLTFGYAIFRYRLMDVDLIFKRGMAYTIAAGAITAAYFAAVGVASVLFHQNFPSAGPIGLMVAIAVTALLFDPFKNWVQDYLDKFFYRKRYDYRSTLIEFGRDLNSETDLDKMLSSIVDRLSRTLLVDRLAIFLSNPEQPEQFSLAKSYGIADTGGLNFDFLHVERPEWQAGHLFFDNTNQAVREQPPARETIRRLELNYYIPCTVMNRMIAVLGLGKTAEGDFLSSEDVQLLETLAGYIGIAVQNARLYKSLEQKAGQYERLKEFNENIVESISVGVLAVDLEDRIESWNSQMEVMFALPRLEALGRPLREVMSAAFLEEYYRVRQSPGIHNLYKFRLGTTAGDTRVTNIAIAPLVSKDFSVVGRLIIVDDITERIELESQLSQAEKLSSIGLLAAGVAHEVNTPLAVISSYAQMLAKQMKGDEKQSALLEKITQPDLPRLGDRQRPAELLAHLEFGVHRRRFEPRHPGHADPARSPVQDRAHQGRTRTASGAADHSRQHRQAAAGLPEPVPQRQRRHARRRHAEDRDQQWAPRAGEGLRHRLRHRAGTHPPHLRSVLHHQEQAQDRPQRRHWPRTLGHLRHHPGARRQDPRGQRSRPGHHLHHGVPSGEEGSQCLKPPSAASLPDGKISPRPARS